MTTAAWILVGKIALGIVLVVLGAAVLIQCAASPSRRTRSTVLKDIARLQAKEVDGLDADRQPNLAQLLFEAGDFGGARELLRPLAKQAHATARVRLLMAKLVYLHGQYTEAERLLLAVKEQAAADTTLHAEVNVYLAFVYYQTQQFSKAAVLSDAGGKFQLPVLEQMRSFGQTPPYVVNWPAGVSQHRIAIPFVRTDPLPLFELTVNGRTILVNLDTGGDQLYLDRDIARELGIEAAIRTRGSFAGGKQADVGFARADEVRIGEVVLRNVPISIAPIRRLSGIYEDAEIQLGGIVGTGVLKQFLSTIDYSAGRLILRPRSDDARRQFAEELAGRQPTRVPFFVWATHVMLARGGLNETRELTFFIDSGLAGEPAFAAPRQTLVRSGIAIPKTTIDERAVGGPGGNLPIGLFPIDVLTLGELEQIDLTGIYGVLPPESHWQQGFLIDGLLSHRFLCRYRWSIDFDTMTMIFE